MDKYQITLTFEEPILGTVPKDATVYATYIASRAALNDDELAEELATVEETEERGWTGFRKAADGTPILMDYMLKGFFKDACGMLRRVKKTESAKMKAYKKIIDGLVFVEPRYIPICIPAYIEIPVFEEVCNPDYVPLSVEEKEFMTQFDSPGVDWENVDPIDLDRFYDLKSRPAKFFKRQVAAKKVPGTIGVLERPLRAATAQGERVTLARSDTCPAGASITFTVTVMGEVSEELLREWLDYGHYRGLGQWRNAGWGKFTYEMEQVWPV